MLDAASGALNAGGSALTRAPLPKIILPVPALLRRILRRDALRVAVPELGPATAPAVVPVANRTCPGAWVMTVTFGIVADKAVPVVGTVLPITKVMLPLVAADAGFTIVVTEPLIVILPAVLRS